MLVVDDSRLQRRILASSLKKWGFEVVEAESGEQAMEICQSDLPDLVLSDWMMPGMDGLEFCRAFRALPGEDYGYFILLTAKSEKVEIARGLDAGADDFLTKPVNPSELRARISAGERIIAMQRELSDKNRVIRDTLDRLQAACVEEAEMASHEKEAGAACLATRSLKLWIAFKCRSVAVSQLTLVATQGQGKSQH